MRASSIRLVALLLAAIALVLGSTGPASAQPGSPAPASWAPDRLLPGFWARTIDLGRDVDGPVRATLVRRPLQRNPQHDCAVLYIHGYVDYFLQPHLADYFDQAPGPQPSRPGCDFFALDLRRYGRSLDSGERYPNFATNLDEYFPEITTALDTIAAERYPFVLLNGHSTGGLIAARYLQSGPRGGLVNAVFLNSPFLDFSGRDLNAFTRALAPLVGRIAPRSSRASTVPAWYAKALLLPSICADCHGLWRFELPLKPIEGFPVFFGWVRAILEAQARVRGGGIRQPILILHSATSNPGTDSTWHEEYRRTDIVLDVSHIKRDGPRLGPRVTVEAIEGGVHDLTLSDPDARASAFAAVSAWLQGLQPGAAASGRARP